MKKKLIYSSVVIFAFIAGLAIGISQNQANQNSDALRSSTDGISSESFVSIDDSWKGLERSFRLKSDFQRSLIQHQIISKIPKEGFEEIIKRLQTKLEPTGPKNPQIDFAVSRQNQALCQRLIFERWAIESPFSAIPTIKHIIEQSPAVLEDSKDQTNLNDSAFVNSDKVLIDFFKTWIEAAPQEAWRAIRRIRDEFSSDIRLYSSFDEILRRLPSTDPEWAVKAFASEIQNNAPFDEDLYYEALRYKIEIGAESLLSFLIENIDYIPEYAWNPEYRFLGRTSLVEIALEDDTERTFEIWTELNNGRLFEVIAQEAIFYALKHNDLKTAKRFFDRFSSSRSLAIDDTVDAFAATNSFHQRYLEIHKVYFSKLAESDLDSAINEAIALTGSVEKENALGQIATVIAPTNPAMALELCKQLSPEISANFIGEVFSHRIKQDLAAARIELASLNPQEWSEQQQSKTLRALYESEPIVAAEFFNQIGAPPSQRDEIQNMLSTLIDESRFEDYVSVTNLLPPIHFDYSSDPHEDLASAWSHIDSKAAKEYGLLMPPGRSRSAFLESYASTIARLNYETAWREANRTEDPYLKRKLQIASIQEFGKLDPVGAIAFALEASETQDAALPVIEDWIQSNSESAYSYIQTMPESAAKTNAMATYIVLNASNSLEEAQSIIETLPTTDIRNQVIETVADEWATTNPSALADWIATMPVSEGRDGAIAALADALHTYDYIQAFDWALAINSAERREWRLRQNLAAYAEIDPNGAETLLQETDLPEDEKVALYRSVFAPDS